MQIEKRFWVTAKDGKEFDANCEEVKMYRKYHPTLSIESAMIAVCEAYEVECATAKAKGLKKA